MTPSKESPTTPDTTAVPAGTSIEAPEVLAALAPAKRSGVPSMESVLQKRWARLLIPSLSDLFFVAILAWVCIGASGTGWDGLLVDADLGWHIRTGEYILDNGTVPYQDLYSFSKAGDPWYAWEWLTDVLDAVLHRWAGMKGVVLAAGVILAIFATTLLRRMVWRDAHLVIAIGVALLGLGAASIHFLARPHIFTLLLMSISVWMIESDRIRPSRRIWLLVPITLVWTNLHGGFLAIIAVLGLTAVGTAAEVWLGSGRTLRDSLRYLKLTAACALASLVNPYGWNLHLHVQEYLRSDWIRNMVQEFQSPAFRDEAMLQFEALLLVGVLVAGSLFRGRKVVEALWILFWVHMALSSVRHVPVFVAIATPVIAVEMSVWWRNWTASAKKSSLPGILNQMAADASAGFRRTSLLPWVAISALVVIDQPIKWPKDFPAAVFPTKIVHENLDLIMGSRVLTTDQWGDYLIYTDPKQKVFIDGRSDFYGPGVGREYIKLLNGEWQWRETMAKYGFNVVLLRTNDPIVELLKHEPGWSVVTDNGKEILLVRR